MFTDTLSKIRIKSVFFFYKNNKGKGKTTKSTKYFGIGVVNYLHAQLNSTFICKEHLTVPTLNIIMLNL